MIITVQYRGNDSTDVRELTFDQLTYGADTAATARRCVREIEGCDTLSMVGRPVVSATCDYCDQPATKITRDGGEPLCVGCGREQYDSPKDSLSALTLATFATYGRQNA